MLRLCALLLLLSTATAHAACRVEPEGTTPLGLIDGHVLVTVQVNGVASTFILDTGADRTLMDADMVRRMGIERDQWVASTVRGIGGYEESPNALPRSLQLAGVTLRRKTLAADNSVTVGPLPISQVDGHPIAGLLGRDFLSAFDLDLDLPAHRLTLYSVEGCRQGFLPWTTPYMAVPATTPIGAALVVPVSVDGHPLRALIDSGASSSLITASGIFRLGLTQEQLAGDPGTSGSGVGPHRVLMHLHRFATLRVGADVTRAPQIWVAPVHVVPIVDMLLGADWLSQRHVWLSYTTKQLCVAVQPTG